MDSHRRIAASLGLVVVTVTLTLLLLGCSDDKSSPEAVDRSGADAGSGPSDEGEGGSGGTDDDETTTSTIPLVSIDELGLDETQRTCVETELGTDVDPDEVKRDVVQDAMAVCVRAVTFGPAFTDGLSTQYPGVYSEEQLACLDQAYSSLPGDDYDLIIASALSPTGPDADRARDILRELFESCDATVPPDL
jgi:hypothetical protein